MSDLCRKRPCSYSRDIADTYVCDLPKEHVGRHCVTRDAETVTQFWAEGDHVQFVDSYWEENGKWRSGWTFGRILTSDFGWGENDDQWLHIVQTIDPDEIACSYECDVDEIRPMP